MDLFCSFSTEYYFGLNLVRIPIIFFLVRQPTEAFWLAIKKTIISWIPYAISMAVFLLWRVVLFGFPTYEPQTISNISSGNLSVFGRLLFRIVSEPVTAGIVSLAAFFPLSCDRRFQCSFTAVVLDNICGGVGVFLAHSLLFFEKPG